MSTTNMMKNSLKYTFLMVPVFLASCGGNGKVDDVTLPPLDLPSCPDGSLLGITASKTFECRSAPTDKVTLPSGGCKADDSQALNTTDGKAITCVDKAKGGTGPNPINTRIDMSIVTVDDQITRANNIKNGAGGGAGGKFVGITTTSTNGKITKAGVDSGFPAAHALCNDQFAGSHMCSLPEIYASTMAGGLFKSGTSVAKSWIYFPAGRTGGEEPNAGLTDNCGSMTYPTGDKSWQGIAFEWKALSTASYGLAFHGGSAASCASSFPIACCK